MKAVLHAKLRQGTQVASLSTHTNFHLRKPKIDKNFLAHYNWTCYDIAACQMSEVPFWIAWTRGHSSKLLVILRSCGLRA